VHQLLHYASRLPVGVRAPFQSAVLQSNAIVCVFQFVRTGAKSISLDPARSVE
jgi:hypothetical protein